MTVLEVLGWGVLAAALLAAWRAARERREAVARAAHELRGPLTAISLGLGSAGRDEQAVGGAVLTIGSRRAALQLEVRRAQVALEDLDAVVGRGTRSWRRRGTAAGESRRLEVVAVDELLADSVAAWSTLAPAFDAELLPPPPTAEPAIVLGDPARLAQATGNLIANALEHGGGRVRARCRVTASMVRVEVSDGGPGLPAPVDTLVQRGRWGFSPRDGRRGHGLRIVAGVAAAHGGRLSCAPAEVGAGLALELPRYLGPS